MPFGFDATLGLTCAAGIYKFLDWCDGNLSAQSRQELARWLTNHSSKVPAHIFASLIDLVFGPKVWSLRFFLRSYAAGVLAAILVLLLYLRSTAFSRDVLAELVPMLCLYTVVSIGPTYLSVVISRSFVLAISAKPARGRIAALVCLDLLLKAALGSITIYSASLVLTSTAAPSPSAWAEAWQAVTSFYKSYYNNGSIQLPFQNANGLGYGLLYYPIFFTSLWIWLYAASGALSRLIARIGAIFSILIARLDIDNHPLRSAWVILAPLTFLVAFGLSLLYPFGGSYGPSTDP